MRHPLFHAARQPDKPALIWAGDSAGSHTLSYDALMDQAVRGARLFRHCGLERGDGIAVLAEDRPETLAVYWAAQLGGLWYTPVDVRLAGADVQAVLNDCGARLLVTSGTQLERLAGIEYPQPWRFCFDPAPPRFYRWQPAIAGTRNDRPDWLTEGAEVLYGTSDAAVRERAPGAPLGTPPPSAERFIAAHAFDARTVLLTTLPLARPDALCAAAAAHRVGGTVVAAAHDPQRALAEIVRQQATHSLWDAEFVPQTPDAAAALRPPHRTISVPEPPPRRGR